MSTCEFVWKEFVILFCPQFKNLPVSLDSNLLTFINKLTAPITITVIIILLYSCLQMTHLIPVITKGGNL